MIELPPLSLYIHVPWCVKKCPYCDFNSHEGHSDSTEKAYITTLIQDFQSQLQWLQGRSIQSIFIGGGTPSLFSAASYVTLFEALGKHTQLSEDLEITLEANPGTFEQEKFKAYRQAGINRLSIGVQSFQNIQLKKLGRIHSSHDALTVAQAARDSGFDNFNIDLMFGLPEQSLDDALADLQQAINLKPTHLSWYQLTIEPNTVFYKRPPKLPSNEAIWTMQEAGLELLERSGFKQYEISAYSTSPVYQSKHNLNYWTYGDYLAIGAGAHGKASDVATQRVVRWQKTRSPKDYLNRIQSTPDAVKTVPPEDLAFEFMLNHLRLHQWCDNGVFEQRTGLSISSISKPLKRAEELGLMEFTSQGFRPSTLGHNHLNDLLQLFMTD